MGVGLRSRAHSSALAAERKGKRVVHPLDNGEWADVLLNRAWGFLASIDKLVASSKFRTNWFV